MIFLTLGTQLPFDRLVEGVDSLCGAGKIDQTFGQISEPGEKGYYPKNFAYQPFLEPAEYQKKYSKASLIVAHAGMGSIITALTQGKAIVIMPRKASLSEHRNEHQLATAAKFEGRKGVFVAWEVSDLETQIYNALQYAEQGPSAEVSEFADPSLISAIRDFIHKD